MNSTEPTAEPLDMARSIDLGPMFDAVEQQLSASLALSRGMFAHAGIKGGVVESAVRDFLGKHLARYLEVGTGEVIDLNGRRSGQLDVIIANADQPFRSGMHTPWLYLIEGVSAAAEVKSVLTTTELRNAIEAGHRFKLLRNTHRKNDTISTNQSDLQRYYECPPFFVVALDTNVATGTTLQILSAAELVRLPDVTSPPLPPIDAVFILGTASLVNYSANGSFGLIGPDGVAVEGWAFMPGGRTVTWLLSWLHAVMPRVMRFRSISVPYMMEPRSNFFTVDHFLGNGEIPDGAYQ